MKNRILLNKKEGNETMFSPKVCVIKMRKVLTGPNPETSLETHNGGKREVPTGPNSGVSPSTSSKAVVDPP